MDFDEFDYSNVVWDTRTSDSPRSDDSPEEEENKVTATTIVETAILTTEHGEPITNNIDERIFSTNVSSSISSINNYSQLDFNSQNNQINLAQSSTSDSDSIISPIMTITVTNPRKELDGTKDAFVSYEIITKSSVGTFKAPTTSVRRRFQDFVILHTFLNSSFQASVIPPLPDKHRMEYITGDRFSDEFLEKRRASLQRFLERLARHPLLGRSRDLIAFLESREWNANCLTRQKDMASDGILEHIGDALINAFSRIKKPDERFEEIKENIDKLEENLQAVERIYQRIIKRQTDLEADYRDFGNTVTELGQLETGLKSYVEKFGETSSTFADAWKGLTTKEENEFISQIKDFLNYCHCVKNLLKLRDQKQVDFEALTEYLQGAKLELDSYVNTGKASTSISSYMRERIDNFKGVDQVDKQEKLEKKISELEKEVVSSNDESNRFSTQVIEEYEVFQHAKIVEFKSYLLSYTENHVDFYKKSIDLWEEIIPVLENTEI